MNTALFRIGALSMGSVVGLAAYGSHVVQPKSSDAHFSKMWDTANLFHALHSSGMMITSIYAASSMCKRPNIAVASGYLMGIGTLLFCGSLYDRAAERQRPLLPFSSAALAPKGGMCMMAAWVLLCFA
eukprot:ANDGO_08321.mRNA.1 UPF0382 membrane protein SE_0353